MPERDRFLTEAIREQANKRRHRRYGYRRITEILCVLGGWAVNHMRDELLDGELFLHLDEMKYVVERWRMDYNHHRPHSSLGYMTPAGIAERCRQAGCLRPPAPVLSGVQGCGILS